MIDWTFFFEPWERCTYNKAKCTGARIDGYGRCLEHLTEEELESFLATLHPGRLVDARGTLLSEQLLKRITDAIKNDQGVPEFGAAAFLRTRFIGTADFSGCRFLDYAGFMSAHFEGEVTFDGSEFMSEARFDSVVFTGYAGFSNAIFRSTAFFGDVKFKYAENEDDLGIGPGSVQFIDATFQRTAQFSGSTYKGMAWFERAKFEADAYFNRVKAHEFKFSDSQFLGKTSLIGMRCESADFDGVRFFRAERLGPLAAEYLMDLDGAQFDSFVTIEVATLYLSCKLATFHAGVTLKLRWADVTLDGTLFKQPSSLIHTPILQELVTRDGEDEDDGPLFDQRGSTLQNTDVTPRLLSLRGVDAANLVISDIDLRACVFQEVHNLDQLKIEGQRPFAETPHGWKYGRVGGQGLPIWRWSQRQTIAEEHLWRSTRALPRSHSGKQHPKIQGWYPSECQQSTGLPIGVRALGPDRIASLYRSLRKAQEESRNEPGAADFYYGEMEMRRLNARTSFSERTILWLYWLLAGYGLRAWRALASTVATLLLFSALFVVAGFSNQSTTAANTPSQSLPDKTRSAVADTSFTGAVIFSARTAIGLQRDSHPGLTLLGEIIQISLRLIIPVLLGLAVISIRGRVKR